jgi:hypothetical protein
VFVTAGRQARRYSFHPLLAMLTFDATLDMAVAERGPGRSAQ